MCRQRAACWGDMDVTNVNMQNKRGLMKLRMLAGVGYTRGKNKIHEILLRVYILSLYDARSKFERGESPRLRITARRNVPKALLRDYSIADNL